MALLGMALGSFLSAGGCALWRPGPTEGQRLVQVLQREIAGGLERRHVSQQFEQFRTFTAELLDASAGQKTFSDKTGNCRLPWFDELLRDPVKSISEAEEFTRLLHEACCRESGGLHEVLTMAGRRLGAGELTAAPRPAHADPLRAIEAATGAARASFDRAIAPLTREERQELLANLYEQTTGGAPLGHRFADADKGRRVCDLLEKMDRRALLEAADALTVLADTTLLRELGNMADGAAPAAQGVKGALARLIETPHGLIVVGGRGANEYDLDAMRDVCAVVDLGGDDVYIEGTTTPERPVLVVLDLSGNDVYRGERPGIQGGAVLGVSMLVDCAGNDQYRAGDVAQGSCLGGVGILIDCAGNDTYRGDRRVQGQAVAGVGLLIDRAGNDDYRAALLSQGVGGPLGFGLLDDLNGSDHYFAGGKYPGGYDDTPGYGSWSQGVGVGPRGSANGGIGVILDGGGDDVYEYDYFGHGGGYWFAAGFARDFGGNDQRIGSTRTMHDGSPRQQAPFVRWGVGYGCHYALGFLFDDSGDDCYRGDHATVGYAWDIAVGIVCDFKGNDRYESAGSGLAQAHNAGLAVLFDAEGNDVYLGASAAEAGAKVDYHPQDKAGGNFAFLIDLGGEDRYSSGLQNNTEQERGWAGGFFIDRAAK